MFSKTVAVQGFVVTICLILTISFVLKGDLKYQESTQITGGMMEGMTKMLGFFGAKGLNNVLSTNYIKGDCMRRDSFTDNELTHSEIIRVDREEIISLNHKSKTYSVMTFEQMRQQMEKAMESTKKPNKDAKNPDDPDVKLEPKISVKDTGETRVINGYNTRHMILSVQFEGQDQKTKDKGTFGMDSDLWITKDIQGFEEQKDFYRKCILKMGSAFMRKGMGMGASPSAQDPRVGQALEELRKQSEKMEGVPVLSIASVNISGTSAGGSQPAQTSSSSQETSSSTDNQESLGKEAVGKSLGKVLGGFGGFRRKKKKEEEPKPTPSAQSSTSSSGSGSASINLMKTTTELKSVSNTTLDPSLFEVPHGYRLTQK